MLFSHVKISCFRAKAHLVFHWCLYNKLLYVSAPHSTKHQREMTKLNELEKWRSSSSNMNLHFQATFHWRCRRGLLKSLKSQLGNKKDTNLNNSFPTFGTKPSTEGWTIRKAFWKLSSNVRPMAIT